MAVYKTECSYDTHTLQAARLKPIGAKRDSSVLTEQNPNFEFLLLQQRHLPDTEALDIHYHIRTSLSFDSIAEAIRNSDKNPKLPDPEGVETFENITGDPVSGQKFSYGHNSHLGLTEKDVEFNPQKPPLPPESRNWPRTWTNVTDDVAFIDYLLQLYFTWR